MLGLAVAATSAALAIMIPIVKYVVGGLERRIDSLERQGTEDRKEAKLDRHEQANRMTVALTDNYNLIRSDLRELETRLNQAANKRSR